MAKKIFEPNKWIKFEINGYTFIGRTIETDEGEQLVSAVDIGGNSGFLTWEYIEENADKLTKLNFVPSNNDKEIEKHKPSLVHKNNTPKQDNKRLSINGIVLENCTEEEAELIKNSILFYNGKKLPEA